MSKLFVEKELAHSNELDQMPSSPVHTKSPRKKYSIMFSKFFRGSMYMCDQTSERSNHVYDLENNHSNKIKTSMSENKSYFSFDNKVLCEEMNRLSHPNTSSTVTSNSSSGLTTESSSAKLTSKPNIFSNRSLSLVNANEVNLIDSKIDLPIVDSYDQDKTSQKIPAKDIMMMAKSHEFTDILVLLNMIRSNTVKKFENVMNISWIIAFEDAALKSRQGLTHPDVISQIINTSLEEISQCTNKISIFVGFRKSLSLKSRREVENESSASGVQGKLVITLEYNAINNATSKEPNRDTKLHVENLRLKLDEIKGTRRDDVYFEVPDAISFDEPDEASNSMNLQYTNKLRTTEFTVPFVYQL